MKIYKITLIAMIVLFIVFGAVYMSARPMIQEEDRMMNFCEENNFDGNIGECRCFIDCKSLEKEYFKFDAGGLGSSECWCKLNNTVGQVW